MSGKSEGVVQAEIRLAVSRLPFVRVWRNNTGKIEDPTSGQWVSFGLGVGGADVVGMVQLEGSELARFFAIEVKREKGGRISDEQRAWLGAVNKRGGAAAVCRSAQEAVEFAHRARGGEHFIGVGPFEQK